MNKIMDLFANNQYHQYHQYHHYPTPNLLPIANNSFNDGIFFIIIQISILLYIFNALPLTESVEDDTIEDRAIFDRIINGINYVSFGLLDIMN